MVAMGPLPQLYRLLVAGVVVLLSVAGGVWLAGWLTLPLGGVGVGLGAGCLLAFLVTRDHAATGPARAPRHR